MCFCERPIVGISVASQMDFKGRLGSYKIIQTEDNTQTVWSEYFNEACHNVSGAWEETFHNYIEGCELSLLLKETKTLHVLDVGFGIGVGLKALAHFLKSINNSSEHFYTSIELDETLIEWTLQNTLPELSLHKIEDKRGVRFEGSLDNIKIVVFIGDGRLTLPHNLHTLSPFNAIFQDAFSPKKNPALWSVEWFCFLKKASAENVRLSTYSSSISIRKSLLKAGWAILSARGFGMKRQMTKANLMKETPIDLLDQLNKSPILEITDN